MRCLLSLFLALSLSAMTALSQTPAMDSLRRVLLTEKLDSYVEALVGQPLATHAEECDFLIDACRLESDRSFVALHLYQHYTEAKWMGAENVAVHIADEWILNKKVSIDDVNFYRIFAFAEFNRLSLIGAEARPLQLQDRKGNPVVLDFGEKAAKDQGDCCCNENPGRYAVLYFYSPTCSTCRLTTPGLVRVLKPYAGRLDCYAVNVDTEREPWNAYLESHPDFAEAAEQLWDPEAEGDFPRDYGVLQTPQLFLITPEGLILGRRLDPAALQELLQQVFDGNL